MLPPCYRSSWSWAQGFRSRVTGDLDLRAFSSGLDLALINAFRNPQVSRIGGILSLDVRAHGPSATSDSWWIHTLKRGGHAMAENINVEISEGSADIQLGPQGSAFGEPLGLEPAREPSPAKAPSA